MPPAIDPPEEEVAGGSEPQSIAVLARRALTAHPADVHPDEPECTEPESAEPVSAEPETTEPETAQPGAGTSARRRRLATGVLALVTVAALVFAAVSILAWHRATHSTDRAAAAARDDVLTAARIDIATLNTVSYTAATAGLQRWETVTTGDLHTQIASGLKAAAGEIAAAKTSTTASVLAAAVTTLDGTHGSATVIVSVQLTKTPSSGQSVVDRNRVQATFTRVHGVWLVSSLQAVPVELS